MLESPEEQRIIDTEHLRLLRLAYFVSAGSTAFFALFGVFYMLMGLFVGPMIKHMPPPRSPGHAGSLPPELIGWIFAAVGLVLTVLGGAVAALKLHAARCLRLRTSHGFCVAIAALSCLEMPYGTALGVFSLLVLARPTVKQQFLQNSTHSRFG